MAGEPSTSSRPSAHTQRYDRQLRLWASSGQASLESSKILVLGGSHVGACLLKNLILPGIGSFTLVDGNSVSDADLGNNFFIDATSKGQSRVEQEVKNLCELNPGVTGIAKQQDPRQFVESNNLDEYTLVVAVNQPHCVLFPLAEKAWDAKGGMGVPLMVVRGAGFVGEVQVQVKEAAIIETHPDSVVDLRLVRPWPALQAYVDKYNVEAGDSMERSHVPFIVILLRKLHEWKIGHGGELPTPSVDRRAFTDSINAFRQAANGDDENVDEALAAMGQHVWRPISAGQEGRVPSGVHELFKDEACDKVTEKSSNFWLLVRALRSFVEEGNGTLPLPGSLPDMKSLSATYVELQGLFREKAAKDIDTFKGYLTTVLEEVQLPADAISTAEIESFTKNASYLKLIRGRRLRDMIESPKSATIDAAFDDALNPSVFSHHIALFATEKFYEMHQGRYPGGSATMTQHLIGGAGLGQTPDGDSGGDASEYDEDVGEMLQLAEDLIVMMYIRNVREVVDACREVTRSGHADLPSTAALLGGIAAQEAIKIVTRQYIPIDNTVVYDGIKQAMGVFAL